jgi:hypothetical protein
VAHLEPGSGGLQDPHDDEQYQTDLPNWHAPPPARTGEPRTRFL